MKQLKHFALLGALLFSFIACNEEYEEHLNVTDDNTVARHFKIKKVDFNEISQNTTLFKKLNKLNKGKKATTDGNGKLVFSAENDFYIDTDFATYIEEDSLKHSYTFKVYRDSADVLLENLILNSNDSAGYDLYFVQYAITPEELNQLENGDAPDLSQKSQIYRLQDNTIVNNIFSKMLLVDVGSGDCIIGSYFVSGTSCTGNLHHSYGDPSCTAGDATPDQLVYQYGPCPSGGGGGGSSSTGSVTTSPIHGGGGGAPPTETALANACNKIKNLHEKLPQLKQALLDLKATTNQNHENGIFCDVTAAANNLGSIQNIPTENSAGGQVAPNTNPPYKYIMIAHTHDAYGKDGSGTYSIFSWDDISTISNLLKDGHIKASEFVFYVITADGTQYAITIENSAKLNEFVYRVPTTLGTVIDTDKMTKRQKLFEKFYKSPNGIKVNSNPVTDKRTFLEFLKESNCGLALFEIDNTFDNYTQIYLDSNNLIKQKNCN